MDAQAKAITVAARERGAVIRRRPSMTAAGGAFYTSCRAAGPGSGDRLRARDNISPPPPAGPGANGDAHLGPSALGVGCVRLCSPPSWQHSAAAPDAR